MKEFLEQLAVLFEKHKVHVSVEQEENDSFLYLQIEDGNNKITIDTGYRNLVMGPHSLRKAKETFHNLNTPETEEE